MFENAKICLNHKPLWEKGDEKIIPNPTRFLGVKITHYSFQWHCEKPMARVKKIREIKCRVCERKDEETIEEMALCEKCGQVYYFYTGYID